MKNEIIGIMFALCSIGLCLALFSTLSPWHAELSGEAERAVQAKLDAEACAPNPVEYINNVLYCKCSDSESQRPGKCK